MPNTHSLVVVDVSGIQDYVFRTNDLKHHLGASELVRRATSTWVRENLPVPHNMENDTELRDDGAIESGTVRAEVLYAGGGNVVIVFDDPDQAKEFTSKLSLTALIKAPGLTVTIALRSFEWSESGLGALVSEVLGKDIRAKKQLGVASGEMLGLGVTADCEFTGLPAVALAPAKADETPRRISTEIAAKLDYQARANVRLQNEIGGEDYVYDFDQFGTKGEASYIAVVHTDGNGMGKRFEAIGKQNIPSRQYIRDVRALSRSVNKAADSALKATAAAIRTAIDPADHKIGGVVSIHHGRLPFRPIIFGGDDVTFVCDGRLGLTATAKYLEAFAAQTLSDGTQPTARAGIAIVKTHYPFGRAYALAEELADSAKRHLKTMGGEVSAMDWHFGVNGVVKDLEAIRDRDYFASDQQRNLLMRPIQLAERSDDWRTWPQFVQLEIALNNDRDYPRNKIKAFRETLRGGPDSAKRFIESNFQNKSSQKMLPTIPNRQSDNGWIGRYCVYFDVIEAMDYFVRLDPAPQGGRL